MNVNVKVTGFYKHDVYGRKAISDVIALPGSVTHTKCSVSSTRACMWSELRRVPEGRAGCCSTGVSGVPRCGRWSLSKWEGGYAIV